MNTLSYFRNITITLILTHSIELLDNLQKNPKNKFSECDFLMVLIPFIKNTSSFLFREVSRIVISDVLAYYSEHNASLERYIKFATNQNNIKKK